jgi:putative serine protease PepD
VAVENEDQGASGGNPDDGWREEADGDGLRGWIPPDDRLWRHPSESAASFTSRSEEGDESRPPVERPRSGTWIIGGATACLVVVLVTAGLVIATTGGGDSDGTDAAPGHASLIGVPTTDPGVGPLARSSALAAMVSAVRPSTVALRIEGSHGVTVTTGLVAESGGIIVTTARSLSGARSVTAIEADGSRQSADLVGVDPTSGLGVVRIDDDLPAATFDDDDLSVGQVAVAAALVPGSKAGSRPASTVYAGTVLTTGQALDADTVTSDFSATAIEAPLSGDDLGCPLIASSGQVSGMLEMTKGSGASTMAVFLPAELVIGVVRQIVSTGSVDQGWLGIQTSNASSPTSTPSTGTVVTSVSSSTPGAVLDAIDSGSPAAAAGLAPGDVITGIDGDQVHSVAELRARIYPDPPGTDVAITFDRAGSTQTASVVLADPNGDEPGGDSSP